MGVTSVCNQPSEQGGEWGNLGEGRRGLGTEVGGEEHLSYRGLLTMFPHFDICVIIEVEWT